MVLELVRGERQINPKWVHSFYNIIFENVIFTYVYVYIYTFFYNFRFKNFSKFGLLHPHFGLSFEVTLLTRCKPIFSSAVAREIFSWGQFFESNELNSQ